MEEKNKETAGRLYDYEEIETAVGNILRRSDNIDVTEHHFFPVSFIEKLADFNQNLSEMNHRRNPEIRVEDSRDMFNVWVDNMASACRVGVFREGKVRQLTLIDIAGMEFGEEGVTAITTDDERLMVADGIAADSRPLKASSPEDFALRIETHYERGEVLEDMEGLASLFIHAGQAIKTEVCNANRDKLITPIFNHFKFELAPMMPNILEDLDTMLEHRMVELILVGK